MIDLSALVPYMGVFGPIVSGLGNAVAQRIAPTSVKATSVADQVALDNSAIAMLKAKGDIENGGGDTYPWVWAIIKLQRPIILAIITITYIAEEMLNPKGASDSVANAFQFVGSWLFSERFMLKGK